MDQLDFELTNEFCESMSQPVSLWKWFFVISFFFISLLSFSSFLNCKKCTKLISFQVFSFLKPRRKRSSASYVYELFENQQDEPTKTITPVVGRHLSIDYSNANVGVFDVPTMTLEDGNLK